MKSIDKCITHNYPSVFGDTSQRWPTGKANGAKFSISETRYIISVFCLIVIIVFIIFIITVFIVLFIILFNIYSQIQIICFLIILLKKI